MNNNISVLSERLIEARRACGLSQKEVTDALGLVRFTLMRWEQGRRAPKSADIEVLAAIYQVSSDWLLGGEGDSPKRSAKLKEEAQRVLLRLRRAPAQGATLPDADWLSLRKRDRAYNALQDANLRSPQDDPVNEKVESLREELESVSVRIQVLLSSRPFLPSLPGVPPEVVQAMKDGLVIPVPGIITLLAEKTLVHPHWLFTGEELPIMGLRGKDV